MKYSGDALLVVLLQTSMYVFSSGHVLHIRSCESALHQQPGIRNVCMCLCLCVCLVCSLLSKLCGTSSIRSCWCHPNMATFISKKNKVCMSCVYHVQDVL